ncbi:Cell polarity protein alp11 [Drechslerella dactyloides]|uniref:Cell polarity protein alp11 n=1 Tax=Drechslerella dactyloides TaxID=74499 RepID=A0AAD6NJV5_DREDA|nr:Cell polarity protein alp11 [Drechslerella dactyloides]
MLGTLPRDIIVLLHSENAVTERRVTQSWTIADLKLKLEPVTGIPPSAQRLSYQLPDSNSPVTLERLNENAVQVSELQWQMYTKLTVDDTRPPGLRENYSDTSQVEKYEMPTEEYAKLSNSVLAWKKRNQLGRFDPKKADATAAVQAGTTTEVEARNIRVGARCIVGDDSTERRGQVAYVGQVDKIPQGGTWVGVRLDEPTGKNDGSIEDVKFFDAEKSHGIFVRPSRVTVGDYPPISFVETEDLLEEI